MFGFPTSTDRLLGFMQRMLDLIRNHGRKLRELEARVAKLERDD